MKRPFATLFSLSFLVAAHATANEPARVYRGATLLTVAKGEIEDGDMVVRDGTIIALGRRGQVPVPADAVIVDLAGKVIIPGLVDTHSHIGIYPRPAVDAHQDGNETTGPVQPGLRAIDAIWPGDPGIRMALAGGVTTANIMPGSGNAIGGQTLYVKLRDGTIDAMMVTPGRPEGGLKMANGENPKRAYGAKSQAPATRMKLAALQREQFIKARDYRRKWQVFREGKPRDGKPPTEPDRDPALDALVEVMDRKRTVHFHSHRADDIMTVVRLSEEFGFEVVLQHGTEAFKVADELARRHVPVSMTLPDSPGGKAEVADLLAEAPALLEKAGVKLAINTDDFITESRFLLRTAALAVRGGLTEAAALRALTLAPAEMLHLESRIGSLEPGKDADFVVLSGRPFSVYTQVLQTYIEGGKRHDRAESNCVNYAIGGFALADSEARPKAAAAPAPPAKAQTPDAPEQQGQPDAKQVVVRAGIVHTAGGMPIRDGVIVLENGKVKSVGKAGEVEIPRGSRVLVAAAATPGFVDAHTVAGVSGWSNTPADQDQDERSDPNQAEVRVLDGFNPQEPLLEFTLRNGVTVVHAMPGRIDAIAGQAGIFRTRGSTAEAMTVRFPSAVLFNLGEVPKATYPGKAPGTRMGTAALIRTALVAASNDRRKREAAKEDAKPDSNPKHEALGLLLDGAVPAVWSAHRADDLVTALRLSREFGLTSILDLATEAYLVGDRIAEAKVPVFVHPTMQRVGSPETFNTTLTNAAALAERQVPIAITSAFESYVPKQRVPLFEAAVAMANGLGYDRALRAITIDPARILGIADRYGSLEPGKAGDVVLFDGDPFEYTTHITHVLLDGRVVFDRADDQTNPLRGLGAFGGAEMDCCLHR
jgi:imidazolonepropionase-like amidohydrolase